MGAYCEIHDEPTPTNSMIARTQPAISLGTCGNFQGSIYFYCINNGAVVKQSCFTELPMPDTVIPDEMPGVTIGTPFPATSIHGASDILDYIPEAVIGAADNAGLENHQLAPADPGIVITDAESNDEDMMDDEHSFTWPAHYHDPALDTDHRSDNDSSVQDQTHQDQIKPEQPDEIDEYKEPEPETCQTTRSGRVLRQPT